MKINQLQHQDFIWTWKSNARTAKVSIWLPYLQGIEKLEAGKDEYRFIYNGGVVDCPLAKLDFLMVYGATGSLPIDFLDRLSVYKIPFFIHRRNMATPYVFYPTSIQTNKDVLTAQILNRENQHKRVYIARQLITERFKKFNIPIPQSAYRKLKEARSIEKIRNLEAQVTKRYWQKYFNKLGVNTHRREKDNPLNQALDAGSYFIFGIVLRWALFHKLSPNHGYMHEPTGYPSLCYDLMEPYRYIIEESVIKAHETGYSDSKELTKATFNQMKRMLEQDVYVPATRQFVARKNLLHGAVLALRSYLLGETKRFLIPTEGERKGGRPPKISYSLPGGKR